MHCTQPGIHSSGPDKPKNILRRHRPHSTIKPSERGTDSLLAKLGALGLYRHTVLHHRYIQSRGKEKGRVQVAHIRKAIETEIQTQGGMGEWRCAAVVKEGPKP